MILFQGEINLAIKKQILKKESFIGFISAFIPAILVAIIIIILTISIHWIYIVMLPVLGLFVFVATLLPTKRDNGTLFPEQVYIKNDIIECKGKCFYKSRHLSKIKKIIDKGEWYQIIFYFPYKNISFICQKDLIIKGSIEEFEKIFAGKKVK